MKRLVWSLVFGVVAIGCNKSTVPLTAEQQLEYDVNIIDGYLAENSIDAMKLESGVRYTISELGTGPAPTKDHCVTIRYTGWVLYDTEAFDSNTTTGFKRPLKGLITGMQIGLKLMPLGSKGTLYIPSGLGYGPNPDPVTAQKIPKNAILKFDIEVAELSEYNALGGYCK
jgi:FKBP-type peptidyl-prolyl cis-trans isomerase FkpA